MKKQVLFILALIAVLAVGCNGYKKTKTGLQYKVFGDGKGKKLTEGGFVKFQMIRKWKDSVLMESYSYIPMYDAVRKSVQPVHDLPDILLSLRVGDSVMMLQKADSLQKYQQNLPPGAGKNDKFVVTVKILAFFDSVPQAMNDYISEMRKQVDKENVKVEEYLKKNNIAAVKSPKGIYVATVTEGTGPKADSGKFATVNYTGKTLRGNTFDSNIDTAFKHVQPYSFQVSMGQTILGWIWGIETMKQGGKYHMYIPPSAGYGKRGDGGQGKINGDDILDFEIDVLSVTDTMPAQPRRMPIMK